MIPSSSCSGVTDLDGGSHGARFLQAPALARLANFLLAASTLVTRGDHRSFTIGKHDEVTQSLSNRPATRRARRTPRPWVPA